MKRAQKWIVGTLGAIAVLAACGKAGAELYERWKDQRRQALLAQVREQLASGVDSLPILSQLMPAGATGEHEVVVGDDSEREEMDDSMLRKLAMKAELGVRTPQYNRELFEIARAEALRWHIGDPDYISPTPAGTAMWSSLGPAAARSEYNGTYYEAMDSGRANKIRVDPRDPSTVYIATSGGGVWFANDFGPFPTWQPMTDALGVLAAGALALDTNVPAGSPPVVWVGLGDYFDQQFGAVASTPDNGVTWPTVKTLQASSHPADGSATYASNIREIAVDPVNPGHILAGADDALYRSLDNGSTFTVVDLPNTTGLVREGIWSIVYLGSTVDGGGVTSSHWAVSGVYACPGYVPPPPSYASATCSGSTASNFGDIWLSSDSGATWTSVRAAGGFPASVTGAPLDDFSRMNLAAYAPGDPAAAVVYGIGGSLTEYPSGYTSVIVKSAPGAQTYALVAFANAPNDTTSPPSTAPVNPTAGTNCRTMDMGHDQSYYDLAIAVDPLNPNNALVGGNLCAARTLDGGATWELVAHWLPQGGSGYTTRNAFLPYVHADWHAATIVYDAAGRLVALSGNDGGFFRSSDLFTATLGELVHWDFPNLGLSTHLFYAVASGDPVFGTGEVAFGGLQDNGSRYRLIADEYFIYEWNYQNWDQISGGDGIGAGFAHNGMGQNPVYWVSVQGQWKYCRPFLYDCSRATRIENGIEIPNYRRVSWTLPAGDGAPFFVRYSPVNDAQSSVVTASNYNLWKLYFLNNDLPYLRRLTPSGIVIGGSSRSIRGVGPYASPRTYTIAGKPSRLYGLPLSSGRSALVVEPLDGSATTLIGSATFPAPGGTGVTYMNSVAMPGDPAVLGGTDSTRTWLVGSVAPGVPAHLFKTTDAGATWQVFHGDGTGLDLPNLPVFVVRFDPNDDSIIYAGTEFGLYRSTDAGNTWVRYGVGLPSVRVWDVTLNSNSSLIRVATFGRGVWEIHPTDEAAASPGNGDWDRNGVIDFFDMAPLADRIGSLPSVGGLPAAQSSTLQPYDSLLDVTGTPTAIEEADLATVVANFGSTP